MALGALLGAELGLLLGSYSGYVEHALERSEAMHLDRRWSGTRRSTGRSTRRAARSS
jgi:hypothetical protein